MNECKDCWHFDRRFNGSVDHQRQLGQCKRFPPQFTALPVDLAAMNRDPLGFLYYLSAWPAVRESQYCGEWTDAGEPR